MAKNKRIGNFLDNGDGTVVDTRTGLTWMRCLVGQAWDGETCIGEAGKHSLRRALSLRIHFAGHDNWRLPTLDEMETLIEPTRTMPCIDIDAFPNTLVYGFNWTSTQGADQELGCRISFDDGDVSKHVGFDNCHWVRLVSGNYKGGKEGIILSSQSNVDIGLEQGKVDLSGVMGAITELNKRTDYIDKKLDNLTGAVEKLIKQDTTNILLKSMHDDVASLFDSQKSTACFITDKIEPFFRKFVEVESTGSMVAGEETQHSKAFPSNPPHQRQVAFRDEPAKIISINYFLIKIAGCGTIRLKELREVLFPLNLMPNALIDELNDKAISLVGEFALIEDGDNLVVNKEVLLQVINSMDYESSQLP